MALSSPANGTNTTNPAVNFTWTATDNFDTNLTCNLTLNGIVNASGIQSLNGTPASYTVQDVFEGISYWNVTCIDDGGNANTSAAFTLAIVKGPQSVNITLDAEDYTVNLTWPAVSYADSYAIYLSTNYDSGFAQNVTGITSTNWTDARANDSDRRYYRVAAVRGAANQTSVLSAGRQRTELVYTPQQATGWNLVSLPFNLSRFELHNGSNAGYDLPVRPANCVRTLWRFNASTGWERSDYNGTAWLPGIGDENFTALEPGRGYWFEVNQSCNLTLAGIAPQDNKEVNLTQGWNLAGWYSTNTSTLPINAAPAYPVNVDPANSVAAIDRYNATTNRFEVTIHYDDWGWWPSWNNQDFTALEPGRGYYFDVLSASLWRHETRT